MITITCCCQNAASLAVLCGALAWSVTAVVKSQYEKTCLYNPTTAMKL